MVQAPWQMQPSWCWSTTSSVCIRVYAHIIKHRGPRYQVKYLVIPHITNTMLHLAIPTHQSMSQANDDGDAVHKLQRSSYTQRLYIVQARSLRYRPMISANKAPLAKVLQGSTGNQVCEPRTPVALREIVSSAATY